MNEFLKVMKALSDKNRVKIVKMLQQKEMCVCEVQKALGVSQPAVSKHMKILENAGIVTHRRDGLWVNYSLSEGRENRYVSTILGSLRHWLEDDLEVADLIRRLPEIRRETICN